MKKKYSFSLAMATPAFLTRAAIIAALYTVLTVMASGFGLASGAIQVRFSEAMVVLTYFTPAAVPGLTIGCLISNIITGCVMMDIIFGTLATFLGVVAGYALRKNRWLVSIPPIITNALIIPFVLSYAYHIPGGIPYFVLTVGAGEVISCLILGQALLSALLPFRKYLFGEPNESVGEAVSRRDV